MSAWPEPLDDAGNAHARIVEDAAVEEMEKPEVERRQRRQVRDDAARADHVGLLLEAALDVAQVIALEHDVVFEEAHDVAAARARPRRVFAATSPAIFASCT